MPKRTDISKILVIGSGPIVIGQGVEFDYSGTMCCRTLKQEGYEVVLLNSNPATIMTDNKFADITYIEPITIDIVKKIYEKENVEGVIVCVGGQIALNLAYQIFEQIPTLEVVGVDMDVLSNAENRLLFKEKMEKIGIESPRSITLKRGDNIDLEYICEYIDLPMVVRSSFTLGGLGSSFVDTKDEILEAIEVSMDASPVGVVTVEQSLLHQREFEFEMMRDRKGNTIVVACIENIDPVGIHTGDSISVTPFYTLRDREYQDLREKAIKCVNEIGIIGGCNVQFAVAKDDYEVKIIEMNPRTSRSSALASKATGYPIAYVSTMIYIGYNLDEIYNFNGSAYSMEPQNDSVAIKIPRFSFDKFPGVNDCLTTSMKSIGEVIAIDSSIEQALSKAIDSLEASVEGFKSMSNSLPEIEKYIREAHHKRLIYIADAFRMNVSINKIHQWSGINKWFLSAIKNIIDCEQYIQDTEISNMDFWYLKRHGITNEKIAHIKNIDMNAVKDAISKTNLKLCYKSVDMSGGVCIKKNNQAMYSTYLPNGECEVRKTGKRQVIILGSGPNRIGQGIEFDYCCVNAIFAVQKLGLDAVMINSNPSTVSTDFLIPDRLYISPITEEAVCDILDKEKEIGDIVGVILQLGGQTPLMLMDAIIKRGFKVLGTDLNGINMVEDRSQFSDMINRVGLKYPKSFNLDLDSIKDINDNLNDDIEFPIIIRPSFVIGGSFMKILYSTKELIEYINDHKDIIENSNIIADQFIDNAIELDVDSICKNGVVYESIISEHIEEAGIHSGDSSSSIPPYTIDIKTNERVQEAVRIIAKEINATGFMNVQIAIKNNDIYIIEVNPRASRSIPIVAKSVGRNLLELAVNLMLKGNFENKILDNYQYKSFETYKLYTAKTSVMTSMVKVGDYLGKIGPSMKSTGESMGFAKSFPLAFLKAQIGSFINIDNINKDKYLFISVHDKHKDIVCNYIPMLHDKGFKICATEGTAKFIKDNFGLDVVCVNKVEYVDDNTAFRMMQEDKISIVFMTYDNDYKAALVRKFSRIHNVPLYTSVNVIKVVVDIILKGIHHAESIQPLNFYDKDEQ